MITRTALQVITDSLKLLGVVAGHEVPTSAEQQDSFARLNELIDSWGTHADTMLVAHRELVPLVVGQPSYTIGPGGDVNAPRPMALDGAAILLGTGPAAVERPVAVLDRSMYRGLRLKALPGALVQGVWLTPTGSYAELTVWPVPSAAQTLVLYYLEPVAEFPDLVTPVSLAPGYAKALRTNLALELAPEFGRVVDPMLDRLAHESLADVKRVNWSQAELYLSGVPGVCGGARYDMATDT